MAKINDSAAPAGEDDHRHVLWKDNQTSPGKANGHTHTWRDGDARTSIDDGHSHKIPPKEK